MRQPIILEVNPLTDYRVMLLFDTGEKKLFDVAPYISGEWFGKLKNPDVFNTVRAAGKTIEWAGGQDIAPHELYENSIPVGPS